MRTVLTILLLAASAFGQAASSNLGGTASVQGTATLSASGSTLAAGTPTFSPPAGAVQNPTTVTISTNTPGYNCSSYIWYTTDGSTPTTGGTSTNGSSVSVTTAETIKAKEIGCPAFTDSAVGSAAYTISLTPSIVHATQILIAGGSSSPQAITIPSTGANNMLVTVIEGIVNPMTPTAAGATFTQKYSGVPQSNATVSSAYNISAGITSVSFAFSGTTDAIGWIFEIHNENTGFDPFDQIGVYNNGYNVTTLGTNAITTTGAGLVIAVFLDNTGATTNIVNQSPWTAGSYVNSGYYEYQISAASTGYGGTSGMATSTGSGTNVDGFIFNVRQ